MFDLLVAALPEKHLSQVIDIQGHPCHQPLRGPQAQALGGPRALRQKKMDTLFQLGPLGDRKPSQLLASMLSVCPSGMELQPVFQYLFLQQLPQTLRTLLGEQECGDIRALAALADRLWASHKPQPHEQRAAGGRHPAQEEAVQEEDRRQWRRRRFRRQQRCALPCRTGLSWFWPMLQPLRLGGEGQELHQALQLVRKLEILGAA
jgi:hypothetical protein